MAYGVLGVSLGGGSNWVRAEMCTGIGGGIEHQGRLVRGNRHHHRIPQYQKWGWSSDGGRMVSGERGMRRGWRSRVVVVVVGDDDVWGENGLDSRDPPC